MRIFVGWMCLLLLFGVAGYFHQTWTDEKREEALRLRSEEGESTTHILIGGASNAAPLVVEEPGPGPHSPAGGEGELTPQLPEQLPPEDWTPPVFEVRVGPGQVLSKICAQHYGRATPELVRALAAYNDLADPDALQVGQKLQLPERSVLLAD